MARAIWWRNESGAIADYTIRNMRDANILTIEEVTEDSLTIKWSDDEVETYTKEIRRGRHI